MNAMFDSWEMLRNHQDDQAFAKSMTLFGNGSTMLSRRTVDELIEAAAQILAPQEPAAFLRNVAADRKADTLDRLGDIRARTLVIWSDEDRCLLPHMPSSWRKESPAPSRSASSNAGTTAWAKRAGPS
ncbi:hypothetical protein P4197_06060 [Pseudomonas aeruginosa]|nr:hypothetical protein [Pseudomonas aeruginosa]